MGAYRPGLGADVPIRTTTTDVVAQALMGRRREIKAWLFE
jgi:hypothetical protein